MFFDFFSLLLHKAQSDILWLLYLGKKFKNVDLTPYFGLFRSAAQAPNHFSRQDYVNFKYLHSTYR